MSKTYYIETFGCQMNEYDSEKICGLLNTEGYVEISQRDQADLIIFNTCLIRENAENKLYGKLGEVKKVKRLNPNTIIAVCGCIPQNQEIREKILTKYPFIDLVFGTNTYDQLPELLYDITQSQKKIIAIEENSDDLIEAIPKVRKFHHKGFVNIMYGCNNFCAYCVVPYTRGRERSRNRQDIIDEVTELANSGYKEITLLGQNVNSYGNDLQGSYFFPDLLRELNEISGLERIRYMTSHPKDVNDDFIAAIKDCNKVCNHIHLPVQSGSSKVLKEMNRKYTKEDYLAFVEKAKREIPNLSFSTDFIVGFPGETEEDFEETLALVRQVRFDAAFTFIYSVRPGTSAGKREDQIPDTIKHERFDRLLKTLYPIFESNNKACIGHDYTVLVDDVSKNKPDYLTGRTECHRLVHFKGDASLIGQVVKVHITKARTWYMEGNLI